MHFTKEELATYTDSDGNIDLSDTNITSLPDNLKVGGSLDLSRTKITSLPDSLSVYGVIYKDF